VVGKVVFAEVMLAALAFSGNSYYDNSWSRAAAMVTSPPLRPVADTADCLLSYLSKYDILSLTIYVRYALCPRRKILNYTHCVTKVLSLD